LFNEVFTIETSVPALVGSVPRQAGLFFLLALSFDQGFMVEACLFYLAQFFVKTDLLLSLPLKPILLESLLFQVPLFECPISFPIAWVQTCAFG